MNLGYALISWIRTCSTTIENVFPLYYSPFHDVDLRIFPIIVHNRGNGHSLLHPYFLTKLMSPELTVLTPCAFFPPSTQRFLTTSASLPLCFCAYLEYSCFSDSRGSPMRSRRFPTEDSHCAEEERSCAD